MRLGSRVAVSCGVGRRQGSDLMLLWLRRRMVAVAPIRPLAWERPYAAGVAIKKNAKVYPLHWKFWRVHSVLHSGEGGLNLKLWKKRLWDLPLLREHT